MMHEIWWSLPLTLIVFFLARKLAARFKFPLLNPLLVAMVVIIPFLQFLSGISYDRYFQGSKILNDLLQPAVVALAFPLYEQLHQIRARWKSIITDRFIGSGRGDSDRHYRRAAARRDTANRRVDYAEVGHHADCDGGQREHWRYSAISAVCVIFVGILGAVFGHSLLNLMRIRTKASRGLSMGTASHALGTRCAELDYQEGAFSSLALVLRDYVTRWWPPFLFPLILAIVG